MTITATTPWRTLRGHNAVAIRADAEQMGSPLLPDIDACIAAAGEYAGLAMAMAVHETKFGTLFTVPGIDASHRNALALMSGGAFVRFPSWAAGFAEWLRRLTDPAYGGGVYARTVTLHDLIATYAPEQYGNDVARYEAVVIDRLDHYLPQEEPTTMTTVTIPGLPTPISTSFPVKLAILPKTQTNQRPGYGFTGGRPDFYTQHDTGNPSPGANAAMHVRYLQQGAAGQQLSFHLVVDDHEAYALVPLNEVAWHAGDAAGPGNFDSIACELCVNTDQDRAKARANAAELAAVVMHALGLPIERLVQHNRWSGKNCPASLRGEAGAWSAFVASVNRKLTSLTEGAPAPPPPASWWQPFPGLDLAIAKGLFGTVEISGERVGFDPSGMGVLSRTWFEEGARTGYWPSFGGPDEWTGKLRRFDDGNGTIREYVRAGGGLVLWRPNQRETFRPLKAA